MTSTPTSPAVPSQPDPTATSRPPLTADPLQAGLARVGGHWGLVTFYGVTTAVLGVMLLVWPGTSLLVAAALFAAQLLVNGVFQIVQAFAADEASGGRRALLAVLGAFSVLVGLLCFRNPLQTLAAIALLVGAWWLVSGVIEVVTAIGAGGEHRVWHALMGLVSVVAGVYVLLNPAISLVTLTWVLGIWLVVYGVLAIVAGVRLRSAARSAAA